MMKVDGNAAAEFKAVRLDNFENANKGELVMADDLTGEVVWKDVAGEQKNKTFGPHAIRILPRGRG